MSAAGAVSPRTTGFHSTAPQISVEEILSAAPVCCESPVPGWTGGSRLGFDHTSLFRILQTILFTVWVVYTDLFKGHHGYLFTMADMLVVLRRQVALYLFDSESTAVSPRLTFFMHRYPFESF